jgi:hypothetical protein
MKINFVKNPTNINPKKIHETQVTFFLWGYAITKTSDMQCVDTYNNITDKVEQTFGYIQETEVKGFDFTKSQDRKLEYKIRKSFPKKVFNSL